MNEQIIEQLKKFRSIEPDARFTAGSRRTILALRREEPAFSWLSFRFAGVMAGIVAAVAAAVFMFSGPSATTALASPEALNQEFTNLNINVELKEIDYRENVNQTVLSALSEITDSKISHLNQSVLESESGDLNLEATSTNPQVDDLLNKVIN